jgi:hypothetical protein
VTPCDYIHIVLVQGFRENATWDLEATTSGYITVMMPGFHVDNLKKSSGNTRQSQSHLLQKSGSILMFALRGADQFRLIFTTIPTLRLPCQATKQKVILVYETGLRLKPCSRNLGVNYNRIAL